MQAIEVSHLIKKFGSLTVDVCAIMNARSGKCPENCKFCAQSSHYKTGVNIYGLVDEEEIMKAAKKAAFHGAVRFSIVTAGRNISDNQEFDKILKALVRIQRELPLEVCCSLGILSYKQALALKDVGVTRYHSNIETAPSYFRNICTSHTYEDKLETIHNAQQAGLRVCSGGIIGLGEQPAHRVEMAFALKKLGIDSIPLNILTPIPGTPLENINRIKSFDILRTFAVFRFILPQALIRTAGGREVGLRSLQALALMGGVDGMMIGGYLTTSGGDATKDRQMLLDLNRTVQRV